ncbi:restriction endonuclease subunit S (plasmid) [Pseudomonas luteola]|nr:restriction endonuclease subunit S [Pseudomonas luteola]
MVKLGDVAPAKANKHAFSTSDEVWTLNLDQVEADTGNVLEKIIAPVSEAGSSTHGFDERHVLYSKLRPYLNKVVLPDERGVATTELVPMLPDPQRLDRKYLAYYLRSKSFVDWVSSQVAGAKMPRVSMQLFWQHEIPLPTLPEQKRIAAILDKADAIRRKRQQAIQLADDFLRAVFLDMFGDPVTNPKGWEVKSLGQTSIFENGDRSSNYPSGDDIVSEGVLFLSTKNIVSDTLNLESCQYITEDKYIALSRGKVRKGDLVITLRGTLGSCCIFDCEHEKAFINAQMMIIRPDSGVCNIFLHDLLVSKAIKNHLQSIGQGAAVPQLTAKQLKELMLPIPPVQEQKKYENIRGLVLGSIRKMQSAPEMSLFKAITQKAFAGQL